MLGTTGDVMMLRSAVVLLVWGAVASTALAAPDDRRQYETRVLIGAGQEAVLSSQMAARIVSLTVRDGDRITKDQVLVSFDCGLQKAQLRRATVRLEAARKSLSAQQRLAGMKANSTLETDRALADAAEAEAEAAIIKTTMEYCEIRAPFDGLVSARRAELHQNVAVGQPLLDVYNDSSLEIRLVVPSRWLSWLKPGTPFRITIDETGGVYAGVIGSLGGRVDPASQSITARGAFEGSTAGLLAGMSGTATFQTP